jgi:hypothetical protein
MKKFLAVLAIAGTLVACNNDGESTTTTDSTNIDVNTTTIGTDTTGLSVDTTTTIGADTTGTTGTDTSAQ